MNLASKMRDRMTFYSPTKALDGKGGTINGWTEEFTVPAHIRYLRGGETVQAARLAGIQPVVVTLRVSGDTKRIETSWRMDNAGDGTVFNVRAKALTEGRDAFEITAEGGVEV